MTGQTRGRRQVAGEGARGSGEVAAVGYAPSGDSVWRGTSRPPKVIRWPRAINSDGREKGPLLRGPGGILGEEHIPGSPARCPACAAPSAFSAEPPCKLCPTQGDS